VLLSLVDSLRCPADHEETSLVLSVESWEGSRVSSGVLGCPRCHARYPIRDGVVDFAGGAGGAELLAEVRRDEFEAIRLAAQLGLSEPGGFVFLTGPYASLAECLLNVVDVTCLLVDARGGSLPGTIRLRLHDRLPLMSGALRAAAVDDSRANPPFLRDVARCVRDGGRLVAPADSFPPGGLRIVARDVREWVGQVERLTSLVVPRRAVPR
jgi:uncharacterized protein YbaR (Trm112 family)